MAAQMQPGALPLSAAPVAADERTRTRHNWLLYAYLFLLPLQNVHTGYIPNLGGGFNFLNIGFALSLLGALAIGGHIARWSSVNRWIVAYAVYAFFSLWLGYGNVHSDTEQHFNFLKDALLVIMLLFVVQMSVKDWNGLRRVLLVTLLPLPYMLRVTWSEHESVSRWHYSDALRISGTFSELGANEYASFCVTMAIVLFSLLLAARLSTRWRLLLIGAIGCVAIGVMWSYSRTAYIALMLGIGSV